LPAAPELLDRLVDRVVHAVLADLLEEAAPAQHRDDGLAQVGEREPDASSAQRVGELLERLGASSRTRFAFA